MILLRCDYPRRRFCGTFSRLMGTHRVRAGECFSAIISRHGFQDPAKVFNHPRNAELRRKRRDWNQLFPGDEVFIPEVDERSTQIATGQTHRFLARPGKKTVSLRFLATDGTPRAGLRYVFQAEGLLPREGLTDAKGAVTEEVPLHVERVRVELPPVESYDLAVGSLDPVVDAPDDGVSGACMRLRNLGFEVRATRVDDPAFIHALAAFQLQRGQRPTGRFDDETRDALRDAHGS
jgi:hypothetical protein